MAELRWTKSGPPPNICAASPAREPAREDGECEANQFEGTKWTGACKLQINNTDVIFWPSFQNVPQMALKVFKFKLNFQHGENFFIKTQIDWQKKKYLCRMGCAVQHPGKAGVDFCTQPCISYPPPQWRDFRRTIWFVIQQKNRWKKSQIHPW